MAKYVSSNRLYKICIHLSLFVQKLLNVTNGTTAYIRELNRDLTEEKVYMPFQNKIGRSAHQPLHIKVMRKSTHQPPKNKVILGDFPHEYSRNLSVSDQKHSQKSAYS